MYTHMSKEHVDGIWINKVWEALAWLWVNRELGF